MPMQRTFVAALAGLVLVCLAGKAQAQPQIKTMEVTIKSGDEEYKAFVAMPEGKGPFPGIVVIQEWWGLNDWIKENAKHFAMKGFVAIAPDLYHGKVATEPKVAQELMSGLPKDRALRDLKAAVDKLAAMDSVQKDKIGCIGWCMGGMYSLQLSLSDPRVKSCVMCYGAVVTDPEQLKPLQAKVLGIFGEDDKGIPADKVRTFEQALKTAGKSVEKINIYKGAGHGFMRPDSAVMKNAAYNEKAANDAWQQIDAFFINTLKQ
jgi:carboxymethylenebutenolidase